MATEPRPAPPAGPLFLGPMRLPFLVLAPACGVLGIATAHWAGTGLAILPVLLVLVGGLAAHVSVNALNEYDDFRSGLDLRTVPTPFSGGSQTLPNNPGKAHVALIVGLTALAVTMAVGIYFVAAGRLGLVPLGLLGCLVIVAYTRWMTRNWLLCLVAPGLGFGLLMVLGTDFALSGRYSWTAFVASLVPFFLVSNLLLLNQFPDVEADRSIGRAHLIIAHGRTAGVRVYGLFLAGAYLAIVGGWLAGVLPPLCLLGLATTPLAAAAYRGAVRHNDEIPQLIPALGQNVLVNLATPALVALGLFLS